MLEETLNVLSNVMFPVVVFLLWAVATTIGTIVDQNQPEQHYYDFYPLPIANAIVRLHLTNVFHSVPYISLVVLLLLSMSVCTFRRVIPKRFPKDRAVPIRNFGLHATVHATSAAADADHTVAAYLRAKGFALRSQIIDGAYWIFADKQKWARYGVLVAHLGFTVIAFGVFLGWLRGFSGQIIMYKGDTIAVAPANVHLTLDNFIATFVASADTGWPDVSGAEIPIERDVCRSIRRADEREHFGEPPAYHTQWRLLLSGVLQFCRQSFGHAQR